MEADHIREAGKSRAVPTETECHRLSTALFSWGVPVGTTGLQESQLTIPGLDTEAPPQAFILWALCVEAEQKVVCFGPNSPDGGMPFPASPSTSKPRSLHPLASPVLPPFAGDESIFPDRPAVSDFMEMKVLPP